MLDLLVLINVASLMAFVAGLINPKLVLRGKNRTRLKSSGLYLGLFLASGFTCGALAPKKSEPIAVVAPVARPNPATVKEAKPMPTPPQKITPTPTPTPTITPQFTAFDPSVCKSDLYLPINGASIALYTTCQYININSLKPESVSVVTDANDKNNANVQELQAESGFEGVTWRDYTLNPESKRDVCIEYKDESVSCLWFSDPGQTANTTSVPTVAGTSSVYSGSYGSYHHTGRRRRRR
ncbi:hypothetical protein LC593_10855 [Nostoc sp. CHAB 5844]|nr:hypothetical protein [Nostoc sp. CHAB 5844]